MRPSSVIRVGAEITLILNLPSTDASSLQVLPDNHPPWPVQHPLVPATSPNTNPFSFRIQFGQCRFKLESQHTDDCFLEIEDLTFTDIFITPSSPEGTDRPTVRCAHLRNLSFSEFIRPEAGLGVRGFDFLFQGRFAPFQIVQFALQIGDRR